MINFRYHLVSLIAVFLALAIGVIMGSAVIDRAIVDRLEDQQESLQADIDEVQAANDELQGENRDLRDAAEQLAEEGSQRLLSGVLENVPVLVVATRGVESDGFDDLLALLSASGANRRGVVWLTDRFELDDEEEQRDLAAALDAPSTLTPDGLRSLALTRLATFVRRAAGATVPEDPTAVPEPDATPAATVLVALRDEGFVDYDPPGRASGEIGAAVVAGTRIVLVSGSTSPAGVRDVAVSLTELFAEERDGVPDVGVVAVEDLLVTEGDDDPGFVLQLRSDDETAGRLATVDNIGDFAGRLAAVLAVIDVVDRRVGHYGRGPGAERLLPAPPEAEE